MADCAWRVKSANDDDVGVWWRIKIQRTRERRYSPMDESKEVQWSPRGFMKGKLFNRRKLDGGVTELEVDARGGGACGLPAPRLGLMKCLVIIR